jgi:hypothetical protein
MRKFSKKQTVVTGIVAVALVGTGTAAFAYWTSQGKGTGSATTAAEAATLVVEQTTSPKGMFPGDANQDLVIKVTNPGPNMVQVHGVRAVATVEQAEGAAGTCSVTDYQVNDEQIAESGQIVLKWTDVELGSEADQDSENVVRFFDKTTNQDGCKGASLDFAYTAE